MARRINYTQEEIRQAQCQKAGQGYSRGIKQRRRSIPAKSWVAETKVIAVNSTVGDAADQQENAQTGYHLGEASEPNPVPL
jgi:hypothetical protein